MRAPTEKAISISRLICTGCGAETNAACNCNKQYVPKSVRAAEYIKEHPAAPRAFLRRRLRAAQKAGLRPQRFFHSFAARSKLRCRFSAYHLSNLAAVRPA
jgi:hypothetical protein